MSLTLRADPLPLSRDASGVIRIAGTRVSLDSLLAAYVNGPSIEHLAEAFPDLSLSDIHASLAYYLRHRDEIDEYLQQRRQQAREVEEKIRLDFPDAYRRCDPKAHVEPQDEAEG